MVGRIKCKLIISFLTWILMNHLAVRSPKILRFFNVSDYGHIPWTTCPEVGIHHYCIVVVCLSVQCNDLDSSNQQFQKVIIIAVNFCSFWIRSEESFFGVVDYFLNWIFGYFCILHAGTLKGTGVLGLNSFWSLKHTRNLDNFLHRKIRILVDSLIEFYLQIQKE